MKLSYSLLFTIHAILFVYFFMKIKTCTPLNVFFNENDLSYVKTIIAPSFIKHIFFQYKVERITNKVILMCFFFIKLIR